MRSDNTIRPYVVAVLFMAMLPLIHSGKFAEIISLVANHIKGDDAHPDIVFVATIVSTVVGLFLTAWDSETKNTNGIRFYGAIMLTLLSVIVAIVLITSASGWGDRLKAIYITAAAISLFTLPIFLHTGKESGKYNKHLWIAAITSFAITLVVFGLYQELMLYLGRQLSLDTPIPLNGPSFLLIAPMATGMSATTWCVLMFAPLRPASYGNIAIDKHWVAVFGGCAIILAYAFGYVFEPSQMNAECIIAKPIRAGAVSLLLLVSPIFAVHLTYRLLSTPNRFFSYLLALIIGLVSALIAWWVNQCGTLPSFDGATYYFVSVHMLTTMLCVAIYYQITKAMQKYPWSWVNQWQNYLNG